MAAPDTPSPSQRRSLQAYVCLMRAADAVTRRIHRHLEGEDLTISQFAVLEALLHLGPLPQGVLAAKVLKSSNNMTTVVDNLERRGLVARRAGAEDRRVKRVCLTRRGKNRIADVFPRHASVLVEDFGALDAAEQRELARLCKKLGLRKSP